MDFLQKQMETNDNIINQDCTFEGYLSTLLDLFSYIAFAVYLFLGKFLYNIEYRANSKKLWTKIILYCIKESKNYLGENLSMHDRKKCLAEAYVHRLEER